MVVVVVPYVTVYVYVPGAIVGVPVMVPLAKDSPEGNVPAEPTGVNV